MSFWTRILDWFGPHLVPDPDPPQPPDPDMARALFDAHNSERSQRNLAWLTRHAWLDKAAQKWAERMASTGRMTHGDFVSRIDDEGVQWSSVGENIAYGHATAVSVMASWMSSRGHRANILNAGFNAIGIGIATTGSGTIYWCVDFARVATPQAATYPTMSAVALHSYESVF